MLNKKGRITAYHSHIFFSFIFVVFLLLASSFAADRNISISSPNTPPSLQQNYVPGEYWGFIIGINEYEDWDCLQTAVGDAGAVKDILINNYGFPERNITFLKDKKATRGNILREFRRLIELMEDDYNLFIYYAGHGYLDTLLNVGYWVPYDGKARDLSTFIPNSTIHDLIRASKSRHIYLVSDSCFSGTLFLRSESMPPSVINDKYIIKYGGLKSRQVLTSGNMEPVSDAGYENHSIFAHYFIKAISNSEEAYLTPMSIFEKIKIPIARNSDQTPICKPLQGAHDEGGEFIFVNLKFKKNLIPHQDLDLEKEKQLFHKEREQLQEQKRQLEQLRKMLLENKALMSEQQKVAEEKKKIEKQIQEIYKKKKVKIDKQSRENETKKIEEKEKKKGKKGRKFKAPSFNF